MKGSNFLPKVESTQTDIMSFEEYTEKHQDGVFEYSFEGIDVFGAFHTHDASDPMFDDIERRLNESNPKL